jgi:hypothetical protein
MRPDIVLLSILACSVAGADEGPLEWGGHSKFRLIDQSYPEGSLFREAAGSNALDLEGELRLSLKGGHERWSFETDYQLFALYGDTPGLATDTGLPPAFGPNRIPDDGRRLFDLSGVIHDGGDTTVAHRLDRLWAAWTSDKVVARVGRQALSWGNGLFFSPLDLVNPFDPAAIDTEFKTGDDMLYVQYLRDNGDDVQGAVVFRRDLSSGDVDSGESTAAVKYHGVAGDGEYDVVVARSYGDTVIGLGGVRSIGGAVVRGDVVVTDTGIDTYLQAVANVSYSWTWGGRNVSGALEYYFNGFGQQAGDYDLPELAARSDLLVRLARGELFTVGRNYLAGSLLIEVSPLWTVTPTLLVNAGDPSALLQFMTQYSLSDNMVLLASLNVPVGADGTEFGGIGTGLPDSYLSTGAGVFAQLAWYF